MIPLATYRLQFNPQFTFVKATSILEYLHQLGITHLYLSPIFQAQKGSSHGYDIVDYSRINPELGSEEEFKSFIDKAHQLNMGIICDIVPNHMCVYDPANKWWFDVLEKGKDSPYAQYFDIDWSGSEKILFPILDRPFGEALEHQQISVVQKEGKYFLSVSPFLLPTDPKTWKDLPADLGTFNGKKGDPRSFDALEKFIDAQHYRLSYWRVASEELNCRRFFDIVHFAGLHTEIPEVFQAVHALVFSWLKQGLIDGLRIDHIDGLWDPEQYLFEIAKHTQSAYVVVEKILLGNEKLLSHWPVQGTVGYDFLNQVNGLYVNQAHRDSLFQIYHNFTDIPCHVHELLFQSKKGILTKSMGTELHTLSKTLYNIAKKDRYSKDFTAESLKLALSDIIASFPVYRSYVRPKEEIVHETDKSEIHSAIAQARRRNPTLSGLIFDFIQRILLLESGSYDKEKEDFVMRFQQLTGPIMAKGVEDTALYRFYPLSSLMEVGANLYAFGLSVEHFHQNNTDRLSHWPHSMLASSTHDTKRSEDVRARINVLSEIPEEWDAAISRWRQLTDKYKKKEQTEIIPHPNEEYLFYQTLIGSWPLDDNVDQNFIERIQNYMVKALKEAKVHTSWVNPNYSYETLMKDFVKNVLSDDSFLRDFRILVNKITKAGLYNSFSQLLMKLTSPGIPDLYQGNEIWDFSLVDPDNRRAVDYEKRKYLLQVCKEVTNPKILIDNPDDGAIKLYITYKALHARKRNQHVFQEGNYIPLHIEGGNKNHVIAFARTKEDKIFITVAGRFFFSGVNSCDLQIPEEFQNHTFRDVFTGIEYRLEKECNIDKMLVILPVALLESI